MDRMIDGHIYQWNYAEYSSIRTYKILRQAPDAHFLFKTIW